MAISGIGVIQSGLRIDATRPDLVLYKYSSETSIYQIPYATAGDLNSSTFKVSETEEQRVTKIIENQLVGVSRHHWGYDAFVAFEGQYADKSNHPANNLIVSLSGIEAYMSNVYVGGKIGEYAWSGLSHSVPNYLWISLVEESKTKAYYKSSRQFRDFETRFTTTPNAPNGPESSLLLATYTSGVGLNVVNPTGKLKFVTALDHANNNQNPHGLKLFQDDVLCSGITILNPSIWNNVNGFPNVSGFYNVKYLNNLTQYMHMICSGIFGNIHSGQLTGTFFQNITNLEADPAIVGNMEVVSGMSVSGSFFRQNIRIPAGILVDTIDLTNLIPLTSGASLSGIPLRHHHSLLISSGISDVITPKYPGMVLFPNTVGLGTSNAFEHNSDLGLYKPTLRHKGRALANVYVRQLMPTGCNRLESVIIENTCDSGSQPIGVKIRDCVGTLLTPRLGSSLSGLSLSNVSVSGLDQGGFSQHLPFDLELSLHGTSGLSQYLGQVTFNYRAQRD